MEALNVVAGSLKSAPIEVLYIGARKIPLTAHRPPKKIKLEHAPPSPPYKVNYPEPSSSVGELRLL